MWGKSLYEVTDLESFVDMKQKTAAAPFRGPLSAAKQSAEMRSALHGFSTVHIWSCLIVMVCAVLGSHTDSPTITVLRGVLSVSAAVVTITTCILTLLLVANTNRKVRKYVFTIQLQTLVCADIVYCFGLCLATFLPLSPLLFVVFVIPSRSVNTATDTFMRE